MTGPFRGPFRLIDDTTLPAEDQLDPERYAQWVREQLANLRPGSPGILRFRRPRPTAAFSLQDTVHAAYERVKLQAETSGFVPVERGTGGRLTMFDERALAVTIISPDAEPQQFVMQRYEALASSIATVLASLGIDARIGELQNEYCPGKFSINAEGRIKLVGIAQRMNRHCYQMGAIIAVERSDKASNAIAEAYRTMGLSFDSKTYGAITEINPLLDYDDVRHAFQDNLARMLGL
jgi:octanoyl-[GcvH]:protein N-octanoyltransferase